MAPLQQVYGSADEIPTDVLVADLYEERDGKFVLVGVDGLKSASDVSAAQRALQSERARARDLEQRLKAWGELEPEKVLAQLDEIDELRARAEGGSDPEKIEQLVEARLARKVGPLERELQRRSESEKTLLEEVEGLRSEKRRGAIERAVREAGIELKMRSVALDDAVLLGDRVLELDDEGKVITRDGVGFVPGVSVKDWVSDLVEKKPHWFEGSSGGGAGGSGNRSRAGVDPSNPWSKSGWSPSGQAQAVVADKARAAELARAAGSFVGATEPPK